MNGAKGNQEMTERWEKMVAATESLRKEQGLLKKESVFEFRVAAVYEEGAFATRQIRSCKFTTSRRS